MEDYKDLWAALQTHGIALSFSSGKWFAKCDSATRSAPTPARAVRCLLHVYYVTITHSTEPPTGLHVLAKSPGDAIALADEAGYVRVNSNIRVELSCIEPSELPLKYITPCVIDEGDLKQ